MPGPPGSTRVHTVEEAKEAEEAGGGGRCGRKGEVEWERGERNRFSCKLTVAVVDEGPFYRMSVFNRVALTDAARVSLGTIYTTRLRVLYNVY